MQGQYGDKTDKRLRDVAKEMWTHWGFRKGIMRGYWVRICFWLCTFGFKTIESIDNSCSRDTWLCWVRLLTNFLFCAKNNQSTVPAFIQVISKQGIHLVETFNFNLLAYEFAKRKFGKKYGKDIPIWALLASGSTGGVRFLLFDRACV